MIESKTTSVRKRQRARTMNASDTAQRENGSHSIPLTAVEYFAGIGLVRMGLEMSGWEVVYANDFSSKKHQMYEAFFREKGRDYIVDDIGNLKSDSIPIATLATCSFPCIDLSLAGNMSGINGKHSSAFWQFVEILKKQGQLAPPIILVENVPGWLHSNKGLDFRTTVLALNELGYACDVFSLDALRFVPQSRLRIFLVGVRRASTERDRLLLLKRPASLMPEALRARVVENQDLHWFHTELPAPPPYTDRSLSSVIEVLNDEDERWWSQQQVHRHLEMMTHSHRERVELLSSQEVLGYRTFFRRIRNGQQRAEVRPDEYAGCLRTATGGSAKQFLVVAGQETIRMRALTPREYARLQGVPDSYPITVDTLQALNGFGDAVCVPAIAWIARNALNPLVQIYLT